MNLVTMEQTKNALNFIELIEKDPNVIKTILEYTNASFIDTDKLLHHAGVKK